jgi:hypothetical protein
MLGRRWGLKMKHHVVFVDVDFADFQCMPLVAKDLKA